MGGVQERRRSTLELETSAIRLGEDLMRENARLRKQLEVACRQIIGSCWDNKAYNPHSVRAVRNGP